MDRSPPQYLVPYLKAAERHGGGFGSLLWASPETQSARFAALCRICDFSGVSVLDAGCGRADLLDFLLARGVVPSRYVGLEAVPELAAVAEAKPHDFVQIIRGDFVEDRALLDADAEVIVFSGSLNTLDRRAFYRTLASAFAVAGRDVVFNFLCSPYLAHGKHLTWHHASDVLRVAESMTEKVRHLDDYLKGDCTCRITKGRIT